MVAVLTCSNGEDLWATCTWQLSLIKTFLKPNGETSILFCFIFLYRMHSLNRFQHKLQQKISSINKCDQRTKWLEKISPDLGFCLFPCCLPGGLDAEGSYILQQATWQTAKKVCGLDGREPHRWSLKNFLINSMAAPFLRRFQSPLQTLLNPASDLRDWIHFTAGKRM